MQKDKLGTRHWIEIIKCCKSTKILIPHKSLSTTHLTQIKSRVHLHFSPNHTFTFKLTVLHSQSDKKQIPPSSSPTSFSHHRRQYNHHTLAGFCSPSMFGSESATPHLLASNHPHQPESDYNIWQMHGKEETWNFLVKKLFFTKKTFFPKTPLFYKLNMLRKLLMSLMFFHIYVMAPILICLSLTH